MLTLAHTISSKKNALDFTLFHNHNLALGNDDVSIAHLKDAHDIAQIAHLRRQINLDAAIAIDPFFLEHEKKEMSLV